MEIEDQTDIDTSEAIEEIDSMIQSLQDLKEGTLYLHGKELLNNAVFFSRIAVMLGKNVFSLAEFLSLIGISWENSPECEWVEVSADDTEVDVDDTN